MEVFIVGGILASLLVAALIGAVCVRYTLWGWASSC
jgi:hypothetical protein